ncbi:MAG: hypothetical protein HN764_03520, partial [Gammaproteobacteria bacterium]|nr:hypothetical protein [Gammaproteobacteria bacterium]
YGVVTDQSGNELDEKASAMQRDSLLTARMTKDSGKDKNATITDA